MSKQKLNFNWTYKDYELRACPARLARFDEDEPNETIEFIRWNTNADANRNCYTIAYWEKRPSGHNLSFVGCRPFEHIEDEDLAIIWKALRVAQKVLDGWFDLEYLMEN